MSEAKKRKILVVDDNTVFVDMVSMVFDEDYEVLRAEDGEKGLTLARSRAPDIILLDIMMPKVSGMEMLRALQADMETRSIPIVVLSASCIEDSTTQMIRQEVNVKSFLRKPCGVEALRKEIQAVLPP
ncbi:MAG: response regulator [Elusimicrobia bacterium]|nr:response regulator [Elusimicrobiota bacterium]